MACGNVFETIDEDVLHCEGCLKRMSYDLLQFISSLPDKRVPGNEQGVKIWVQTILENLGWDIKDDSYVAPEYTLKKKGGKGNYRVDYALLIPWLMKKLRCIIEVKAPGKLSYDAENQLLEYAFIANVPLAVLTDGLMWKLYLPNAGKGDKHVCTLDVKEVPSDKVVSNLVRYLSFGNTVSNRAIENAEHDLNERVKEEEISHAWKELLASDKLINLLIKETKRISGDTPERRYVEEFLKSLNGGEKGNLEEGKGKILRLVEFLTPLIKEGKYTRKELQRMTEKKFKGDVAPKTIGAQLWRSTKFGPENRFPFVTEVDPKTKIVRFTKKKPNDGRKFPGKKPKRKPHFILRGKKYTEETDISAYIKIFTILASEDESFLEQLAPQTAGRKKQWLSQNRDDMPVYERAEDLPGGWWLDKNVSNEDKDKRLEKACKIAGIVFGKPEGLKTSFKR